MKHSWKTEQSAAAEPAGTAARMKSGFQVEVLGVRGSYPVPEQGFLRYGGNTSCMLVDCAGTQVLLDAGSGLARWSRRQLRTEKKRADLLLSHLHLDHLSGLPAFPLLLDPQGEVHLYGMSVREGELRKALETLVGPPYWPLGLRDFPAGVEIHEVSPGESFQLGEQGAEGMTVRTCPGNHPGGSLWYRLETSGHSLVYALDCERSPETDERLKAFCAGCDLLIWDACFTSEDLKKHRGWGHSSWEEGIDLGRSARVKRVLMTHYASGYTDDVLRAEEEAARVKEEAVRVEEEVTRTEEPAIIFAKEGMVIEL